jgi:hypothetical protein
MSKYKIEVTVTAACTYNVEVEASSEAKAENLAIGMWRKMLPEDFQVEKGYITDWDVDDTEQLTWECSECGIQISEDDSRKNDELCDACNELSKAEDEVSRQRHIVKEVGI